MKYAVIQIQGKQYRVEEGQIITIDRLNQDEKKRLSLDSILLYVDDKTVKVGTPFVKGAQVSVVVQSHTLGDKIRVATYKAKSRHRRVLGHRQKESELLVEKIAASNT